MKKGPWYRFVLGLIFLAQSTPVFSQSAYFHSGGKRWPLFPSARYVAVQTEKGLSQEEARKSFGGLGVQVKWEALRSFPERGVTLIPITNPAPERAERLAGALRRDSRIARVLEVFGSGMNPMVVTGDIVLEFRNPVSQDDIQNVADRYGIDFIRPLGSYASNGYLCHVPDRSGKSAVAVANAIYENEQVNFCHPDFLWPKQLRFMPNDPLFPAQWHLFNTGQSGGAMHADVRAPEAWNVTRGSSSITIAIIDTGIDIDHEEFQSSGKIVRGFDATDKDYDPRPGLNENHGTAVAGVATAAGNNSIGVTGAATGCRLMPIRLGPTTSDEASCISFAAENGADVINCSWGPEDGLGIEQPLPDVVRAAIDYAADRGRNGKGCVIFWAAGNGNESSDLDGYATYSKVISIAASNDADRRASYSDYGSSVDLCAPSGDSDHGTIITTDRMGEVGYSPDNGYAYPNYTDGFSGTSAASPLACGVAALVLSVNPGLTRRQVQDILQNTAEKIDHANGNYDTNGHSNLYGYGRINALAAVQGAIAQRCDLQVKQGSEQESRFAINNTYQTTPSGDQIEAQSVPPGTAALYHVKIENDGNEVRTFAVKAEENSEEGWSVRYRDGVTDVTNAILDIAGWTTVSLRPGTSQVITVSVTPLSGAMGMKSKVVTIKAFLDTTGGTPQDTVRMTTSVVPDVSASLSIIPNRGPAGGMLTARITVTRTAYTNGFRVDLYRSLRDAPALGQRGENSFSVDAGTGPIVREIKWTPSAVGTWKAWVQVDSQGIVTETDETNNTASADYIVEGGSITGAVTGPLGNGLAGVVITACSISCSSTVTDSRGRYTLVGLALGRYTITPSAPLNKVEFAPPSRMVNLTASTPSLTGVNFNAIGIDLSISLSIVPHTGRVGVPLTATITVTRSGSTNRGFWVDIYANRFTPPAFRQQGDVYFYVAAGSHSVTQEIRFTPTSPGDCFAWAQVDTDGFVDEVDENNNIAGPVGYRVVVGMDSQPGPHATSIALERDAPLVRWADSPPGIMASGMNYRVSWEVLVGESVESTYVLVGTDPQPQHKHLFITPVQKGTPGTFRDWVPAPSAGGGLYYQAVAIVDGRRAASEILHRTVE